MQEIRRIIRSLILENRQMIDKLNTLIDVANQKEAEWNVDRFNRDDIYEEAPDDDWQQITELMHALDYWNNPPRDLKCWYIVELPDGEIINDARWYSYADIIRIAKEIGYTACDENGNPTPDGVPAENGCELYFIYEE